MKRPLFYIGFSYLIGMAVAFYYGLMFGSVILLVLSVFGTIYSAMSSQRLYRNIAICLLSATVGIAVFSVYTTIHIEKFQKLDGAKVNIIGTVTDIEYLGSSMSCEIFAEPIIEDMDMGSIKMRMNVYSDVNINVGDTFSSFVKLYFNNPNDGGYNMYAITDGNVMDALYMGDMKILDYNAHPLRSSLAKYRAKIINNIDNTLNGDEAAAFVKAVVVADKSGLSNEFLQNARLSGVYHLLAISGLHLAILSQIVSKMLKIFTNKRRIVGSVSIIAIWAMAALSGFTFSVLRAAIMLTVVNIGDMLELKTDSLNLLGVSVIAIITLNPYAVGSLSLQLTVLATLGMVTFSSRIYSMILPNTDSAPKITVGLIRSVCTLISCSLAAQVFTLPVLFCSFGYITLIGIVSGIFTIPLMSPMLLIGYIISFCAAIPPLMPAIQIVAVPLYILIELFYSLVALFAQVPIMIYINSKYLYILLLSVVVTSAWLFYTKANKIVIKTAVTLLSIVVMICFITEHYTLKNTVKVITPASSSSIILVAGKRAAIITNDSRSNYIEAELQRYGVNSIDLLLCYGSSIVNTGDLARLVQNIPTAYVVAPNTKVVNNYFNASYHGKRLPLMDMDIKLFGGLDINIAADYAANIKGDKTSVLKYFDFYGIMSDSSHGDTVLIDPMGGVTYPWKDRHYTVQENSAQRSEITMAMKEKGSYTDDMYLGEGA